MYLLLAPDKECKCGAINLTIDAVCMHGLGAWFARAREWHQTTGHKRPLSVIFHRSNVLEGIEGNKKKITEKSRNSLERKQIGLCEFDFRVLSGRRCS